MKQNTKAMPYFNLSFIYGRVIDEAVDELAERICLQHLDKPQLALGYILAIYGDDRRKNGSLAVTHPLAIAARAVMSGIDDEDIIAAILLHDVMEDYSYPKGLEKVIGPRVKAIVSQVTLVTEPGIPKAKVKYAYYKNMKLSEAILIKALDRGDNLRDMANRDWPISSAIKNIRETYFMLLPKIDSAIMDESTPEKLATWLNMARFMLTDSMHALMQAKNISADILNSPYGSHRSETAKY